MAKRTKKLSVSIVPYIVHLSCNHHGQQFLQLDDTNNSFSDTRGGNLAQILDNYLQERHEMSRIDYESQSGIKVSQYQQTKEHTIIGTIDAGHFGKSSTIVNVQSGETIQKGMLDCEFIPLFFRFDVHHKNNNGILLLQRYGQFGAKSILETDINEYLRSTYPQFTLSLNPFVTEESLKIIAGGTIKEICFIARQGVSDVADTIGTNKNNIKSMKFSIKISSNEHLLEKIKKSLLGIYDKDGIEILGMTYDEVKMRVNIGKGKQRTIGLATEFGDKIVMPLDVTEYLEYDSKSGHPTTESLVQQSEEICNSIKEKLEW